MQETGLTDPSLFVDDDAVHDRDLARRPAERERRHAKPNPQGLGKRNPVRRLGPASGCDGELRHNRSPHQSFAAGVQLWVSPWQVRHQA